MTRAIASLCWHQASTCHLVFQIALIPVCAGPHHLVHCKMPLLQYCKAFWAALLEGGPFCFQGHPHFQETALQKGCSAPSDLYLHLSTVRAIHHSSLLADQWSYHCTPPHDHHYFLMLIVLPEGRCAPPWHAPQWAPLLQKGVHASAQINFSFCQNFMDYLFFSPVEPVWQQLMPISWSQPGPDHEGKHAQVCPEHPSESPAVSG